MYLLEAEDSTIAAFKQTWAALGDSIVVVGGDGLWNCHVHTDDIGGAIEAGIEAGRPRQLRSPTCSSRWRKSSGCATRTPLAGAAGARGAADRRSRPRSSRSAWAKASGGCSSAWACTRSWPVGSR